MGLYVRVFTQVMNPCTVQTETGVYSIPTGVTIATLLSITNVDSTVLPDQPALSYFDPQRYVVCTVQPYSKETNPNRDLS
jgi:hypothetical protein